MSELVAERQPLAEFEAGAAPRQVFRIIVLRAGYDKPTTASPATSLLAGLISIPMSLPTVSNISTTPGCTSSPSFPGSLTCASST